MRYKSSYDVFMCPGVLHTWDQLCPGAWLSVACLHRDRFASWATLVLWVRVQISVEAAHSPLPHTTTAAPSAQSVVSHMPGDVCVAGRSSAGLDRGGSRQPTAGALRQAFTSRTHAGHLPRLLAFPTSHRAHTEAGDAVLSSRSRRNSSTSRTSTRMHVAGLLALWPLQALGDAVSLFHHTGVRWVLNPTLHGAVLHASIAGGRALAKDTSLVDICERLSWVGSNSNRGSSVYGISVFIQAHKVSLGQYPADTIHTDISAAHVALCPIHHCRSVSVEEVLSSWDTGQLTWIGCSIIRHPCLAFALEVYSVKLGALLLPEVSGSSRTFLCVTDTEGLGRP